MPLLIIILDTTLTHEPPIEPTVETTSPTETATIEIRDICLEYDGIPNKIAPETTVCCNEKCPKCGGKGCANQKDASGNKLTGSDCCVNKIQGKKKVCRSGKTKAPCKLPSGVFHP